MPPDTSVLDVPDTAVPIDPLAPPAPLPLPVPVPCGAVAFADVPC